MSLTARPRISEKNLPLVHKFISQLQGFDLTDVMIICIQHVFMSTYYMFDALFEVGLDPRNLFILGKCYSSDPRAVKKLREQGAYVSEMSLYFDSHQPYDEILSSSAAELIQTAILNRDLSKFQKIIILDDGGDLITNAKKILPYQSNIIGIEQTTSGHTRISRNPLKFPVIDLARSWLKLQYETPINIRIATEKIKEKIKTLKTYVKKVLILGYGTLGQAIHQSLVNTFEVDCYDPKLKGILGIKDLRTKLKTYDLIIGCSGSTSVTKEMHSLCKSNVVLASISSSDREFDAVFLRRQCPQMNDCHEDVVINGRILLNGGFPINFSSDFSSSDTDEYQLTRALIVASIFQSANEKTNHNEFIKLDDGLQKLILQEMSMYE